MNRKPRDKTEEIIETDYVNAPACTVDKVAAPPEKVIEEASYVNAPACTVDKVAAPPDQRSLFFSRSFLPIAVCWLILLVIMGLRIYFDTQSHQSDESGLMAANRNLTNLNNKLRLDNEKTMRDNKNLTVQLDNLTQNYTVLESKITNLTAVNQQLETQRDNLTKQIQDLETNWNKLNVSRAQWSIDAYCPYTNNGRQCTACLNGWIPRGSNCYVYHDAAPPDRKTWEEARENCRGMRSDLLVVHSQEEKDALNTFSPGSYGANGYWFGLRAEGGRWKWIDGSDLTESYWTPQPPPPAATDGQCAMSVQNVGWISVSCTDRKQWICTMKALYV